MPKDRFGFSTGALERNRYSKALHWIQQHQISCVELSALRYEELDPLINDLDNLPLKNFSYVSFHAPSFFSPDHENHVVTQLQQVFTRGWNIVVHPDVIYTPAHWKHFGRQLLIENMDRRKSTGRTVMEIRAILAELPQARLCLDLAHARQLDTTLTLLWSITSFFKDRIAEVHISELDSHCRHLPLSQQSIADYRHFSSVLAEVPVIIESILCNDEENIRRDELQLAREAMS